MLTPEESEAYEKYTNEIIEQFGGPGSLPDKLVELILFAAATTTGTVCASLIERYAPNVPEQAMLNDIEHWALQHHDYVKSLPIFEIRHRDYQRTHEGKYREQIQTFRRAFLYHIERLYDQRKTF